MPGIGLEICEILREKKLETKNDFVWMVKLMAARAKY